MKFANVDIEPSERAGGGGQNRFGGVVLSLLQKLVLLSSQS